MDITDLTVPSGPDIYYTKKFRDILEDHMTLLRNHPGTSFVTIAPGESYQWRHDLFGLLQSKGIPMHLHWLIMRLNQYFTPTAFLPDTVALLQPDPDFIEKIRASYFSTGRIS